MIKKTVIIGGAAGGATTAARLRRRDEEMEIVILEKGEYISYANCGLPYYIGGVIQSRESLLLQTPKKMEDNYKIDVKTSAEVIAIDRDKKELTVKNVKDNTIFTETYDKLVIATGSTPIRPNILGIHNHNVFTLWNIPDTDKIKTYIENNKIKEATIIGGGFIGLEMAENLHGLGLQVTIIEMQNQVMAPIDFEMAQLLHENITDNGVNLILNDGVIEFKHENGHTEIVLNSGKKVLTDMVILSIGVRANSLLAKEAGLALNQRGGIIVNEYLQTNDDDIYAVGDVIEIEHFVTKAKTMIPLAGPANKQARILADNIVGDKIPYNGALGTSVAKVFDLNVASTGINEKTLISQGKIKGVDYHAILISQKSHAGYYPGSTPLVLKMLFTVEGTILGAQIVGQDGVDKRIDTLATAIRLKGTIYDLEELDFSYAPPFSSAKDPVNMLGYVAQNVLDQFVKFVDWQEFDAILQNKAKENEYILLDVRETVERMVYHIPGTYHIPQGEVRARLDELDKNKKIIVFCAVGVRSYNIARALMQLGYDAYVLSVGTGFYRSMHYNEEHSLLNETEKTNDKENDVVIVDKAVQILDCCGMQCPGPIMKVNEAMKAMKDGEVLQVSATDMGFARDVEAWCQRTNNTFIRSEKKDKLIVALIKKGTENKTIMAQPTAPSQGKTIIVFDGELDKAIAAFIIANGSAAMGRKVTMFFTFWGLNLLRKPKKQKVKKSFMDRMFGMMMPRGVNKAKLSKMNMAGLGTKMIKSVMKKKNVSSLEELMQQAMANGVKLIACTMSMDIMGIKREELIDGIEYAGVATYLGDAEEANVNLFI
ncbi:MAG: CoA-disulfide reductase [Bacilli bacterium]|jgi:NADPH-dependent 2,4-dienoyl-CoA reductase/sulfur reductase-like enzyme/peroxiredoxin family protein/TusA-related sulfurtransferase/rhodanese-related sulfurtransferase|nr:CoA-disulfide reductase [Bacilli bacterium]MDD4056710.1 CoA-disulfide reductase [Bacilli bacterium]